MSKSVLLLPLLFVAACGNRACGASERPAQSAVVATEPDPALPGLGKGDPALTKKLHAALLKKGPGYEPRTRHKNADGSPKYTNRLILETSPYLLQHAHNPVNWYPWGDEAFARARREGKPVLLSVGYSTCHWCHVMERESFENEEIARFINEHFVPIKVDREERPDVDDVYMSAVQMLTGGGGWPMTLALTPDREPFFGGTYFPARDGDRGSRKGFFTILRELADEYQKSRADVVARAAKLSRRVRAAAEPEPAGGVPGPEVIASAVRQLSRAYDPVWGGFGRAPKFPRPVTLELLLRYHRRSGDADALKMVVHTLDRMAAGGLYDHVGGGFHRYSTDARWLVPHFEKMLYDNAQLVAVYLDAYQVSGRDDFAHVARQTLDYVAREMTAPSGGFYSATDADSRTPAGHEEEGWFFTWTPAELEAALGVDLARVARVDFGVTDAGNFEGRSILQRDKPDDDVAKELGISAAVLAERRATIREKLYAARSRRPAPHRDDKIITAWNGLMVSAFSRGALVLGDNAYRERAARAASFVLRDLRRKDGRLRRTVASAGVLDDYAFFIQGLLDLFEASSELHWLDSAIALQKILDHEFADDRAGGYFTTAKSAEKLLTRDKPSYDGAEPSGNSIALRNLLRLAELTQKDEYRKRAERSLRAFSGELTRSPTASPELLSDLSAYLDQPKEVVVVGPNAGSLLRVFRKRYLPNCMLVVASTAKELERIAKVVPAVESKVPRGGKATAYVCERGTCELPTSSPEIFSRQLAKVKPLPDKASR